MDSLPPLQPDQPDQVQPAVTQAIADCKQKIEDDTGPEGNPTTWDSLIARRWKRSMTASPGSGRPSATSTPYSTGEGALGGSRRPPACSPNSRPMSASMKALSGLSGAVRATILPRLDDAQRKEIQNTLRDFRPPASVCPPRRSSALRRDPGPLSELASPVQQQRAGRDQGWSKLVTDEAELAGLPQSAQAAARQLAELKGRRWLFTLDILLPAGHDVRRQPRPARRAVRGLHHPRPDQGPNAGKVGQLRHHDRAARPAPRAGPAAGFANYAELSLATKMADKPEQVVTFLTDLAAKSLPQGKAELEEIRAFAAEQHGQTELAAGISPITPRSLKQHKFAISDEQLRPTSPPARWWKGLFEVVRRVFGMKVRERLGIDTWHPDVRLRHLRRR